MEHKRRGFPLGTKMGAFKTKKQAERAEYDRMNGIMPDYTPEERRERRLSRYSSTYEKKNLIIISMSFEQALKTLMAKAKGRYYGDIHE